MTRASEKSQADGAGAEENFRRPPGLKLPCLATSRAQNLRSVGSFVPMDMPGITDDEPGERPTRIDGEVWT